LNEAAVSNGVIREQDGRRKERLNSPKGLAVSLGFSGGVIHGARTQDFVNDWSDFERAH
jgi:hypothetical protein